MTIRTGVIGFGYWGPNLVRNFSANENFVVAAIADRSAALQAKAKSFLGVKIMADGSELVAAPDIDAVAIATPVATHYELARDALRSGKHVLIEKPMCTTVAEGE